MGGEDGDARLGRLLVLVEAQGAQIASLTAANAALVKAQADMMALWADRKGPQVATVASAILVRELFVEYRAARKHEHSWKTIENKLAPMVRRLGDLPASNVTKPIWEAHRTKRRDEVMDYGRSRGKTPAESSLNEELAKAKTMLEWGVDNGYLVFNPLAKTKKNKTKGPRKTWLKEPQLQQLLRFAKPERSEARRVIRAFILVDFDSGARFEEIRMLRRDRMRQRSDGDEFAEAVRWVVDIDETKNTKAHVIGLTQRTYEALMALDELEGVPFFFVNSSTRKPWGRKTLATWFREACESTRIDAVVANGEIRLVIHDGRRSAATNAHNRGASLLEVQQMLNHSSPAITAQYVQINDANAAKMARLMEDGIEREGKRKPPKRSGDVLHSSTDTPKSNVEGSA